MGAPDGNNKREPKNKRDQRGLYDISNVPNAAAKPKKHTSSKKNADVFPDGVWQTTVQLKYLWAPLGEYMLEVGVEHTDLINTLAQNKEWTIYFIKDFNDAWRPTVKYEARFKPRCLLDAVGQRLFTSTPSLHSCIVVEGKGFLWLNRLPNEPFIRCNWLSDNTASIRILPPINVTLDLDETLIFNSPVKGCPVPLEYVVCDPPHLLVEDADANTGGVIPSSDRPYKRPAMHEFLKLICPYFRNVRVATFSVESRAKEVVEHLDKETETLCKNYKPDPLTGQKPVPTCIFAREALLAAAEKLAESLSSPWIKSLEMLDLPQKGLLQRSIIIDDRVDVWIPNNHDNIVKISGPDKPANIGNLRFMNGADGGEMGARVLLALINLELKSTDNAAYKAGSNQDKLSSPRRLVSRTHSNSPGPTPTSPTAHNNNNNNKEININHRAPSSPTHAHHPQHNNNNNHNHNHHHNQNENGNNNRVNNKHTNNNNLNNNNNPKHNRISHHAHHPAAAGYHAWEQHHRGPRGADGGEVSSNPTNLHPRRRTPSPTPDLWGNEVHVRSPSPTQPQNPNDLGAVFLPAAGHPLLQPAAAYMHPHQPFRFENKRK